MALIAYISDLHLDDIPREEALRRIELLNEVEADYLVMAGDVCSNRIVKTLFDQIKPNVKKIIMVRGNHEYYNNYIGYEVDYPEHVVMLDSETPKYFDDVRFIGDTLWTDIDEYVKTKIQSVMNDYHYIYQNLKQTKLIDPDFINDLHFQQKENIKKLLQLPNGGRKTVVVTHHSPSFEGVVMKYLGNMINSAFHSDFINEVSDMDISYWIHGHCHDRIEYDVNGIKVRCNPMGYYRERGIVQVDYFEV